jgi:hypothetical protein
MVLPVRAQALQLAALQHAQQLGLHGQRELADLVQEQRALMRLLELAAALAQRSREGPAHMAEQLALDQVVGQGRAVDADHGLVGTARLRMHGLGHQLLAGAGLAGDEHAKIAGGDQGNVFCSWRMTGLAPCSARSCGAAAVAAPVAPRASWDSWCTRSAVATVAQPDC